MRINFELSYWKVMSLVALFMVGFSFGGFFVSITSPPQTGSEDFVISTDCLTSTDLNRSDIQTGILLSRFCEGLGLQSSVYWQQDAEGNVFGTPICINPNTEVS